MNSAKRNRRKTRACTDENGFPNWKGDENYHVGIHFSFRKLVQFQLKLAHCRATTVQFDFSYVYVLLHALKTRNYCCRHTTRVVATYGKRNNRCGSCARRKWHSNWQQLFVHQRRAWSDVSARPVKRKVGPKTARWITSWYAHHGLPLKQTSRTEQKRPNPSTMLAF